MSMVPAETAIEGKISPVLETAQTIEIRTEEALGGARDVILGIKALRKEVEDTLDPVISKAHQAHKEAIAAKKKHTDPLDEAERLIKGKMNGYYAQQEEERKKEQARLEAEAQEARKKEVAAADRKMKALAAKGGTIQEKLAELKAQLNNPELSEAEEEALHSNIGYYEERLEKVAADVAANTEKVEAVRQAPAPVVAPPAPKKGISRKVTLVPEVKDPKKLLKAVLDGYVPLSVVKFDMTAIKKLVNGGLEIGGVATTEEGNVSIRA